MEQLSNPKIEVIQNADTAINILRNVAQWMQDTGLSHDEAWNPDNMNLEYLGQYAKPDEFFVATVEGKPAAAAIIQSEQIAQDWASVDGETFPPAIYVHWLAVEREFAGQRLPKVLLDYAYGVAKEKQLPVIRLDTDASKSKLREIYESQGYEIVKIIQEDNRQTVLFEKKVI
ncbi:MAG TPA: GNAT family N-acetyltransferase [Candidatus Saccharimonadia bacterium]|nr:GNAT family N-acetyltransferase [Candidatus Saccharimonadia bacterium]